MGLAIRERLNGAFQALRGKPIEKSFAWDKIFSSGLDALIPLLGTANITQPYAQHPTVYAAISAIATALSSIPLEMFPESDKKREAPITDSIVLQLLREPNEDMDGSMLWFGTWVYRELYGEAFWLLDGIARRSSTGQPFPTRIDLWNPLMVRGPIRERDFQGWELQDMQRVFRVPLDRLIQFKYFNPYDGNRGLPPWNPARVIASADFKGAIWNEAFFNNSALPAGLIVPEQGSPVHKDAMDRLREQWEERHGGATNHGKVAFLNFAAKFIEVGVTHKDMDFDSLIDSATERLLMIWKVPPTVAGMSKNANYQEATRQAKQFYHNHEPSLHYAEEVIYRRLCRAFGIKERPFFKTETIKALVEDQESVARTARELWSMGVPFEQVNSRFELGFDSKEHPSMQEPWLTFSMAPADRLLEDAAAPRSPRPGDTPNQPAAPPTGEPNAQPNAAFRPRIVKNAEYVRALSWRTLISMIHEEERSYAQRVRDHMFMLKQEVQAKIRKFQKAETPAPVEVAAVMFDEERAAKDIRRRTEPVAKSALQKGQESVLRELRIEVDFDLLTEETQSFLRDKGFEIADLVDGPLKDRLSASLKEGVDKGESIQKIADRVEELFSVERTRAERIARTEVAEAFNGGRYDVMKAANVEKIEWLTARDNRVRDAHVELDGEIVMLGDRFSNGLLYPLDPAGPPEEIVNCRCVSLPAA